MTIPSRNLALAALAVVIAVPATAAPAAASPAGDQVVISEVYGGGAHTADASFASDFVELYNPTDATIDLTGYTLHQWGNATNAGSTIATLGGSIGAGEYYLISLGSGSAGSGSAIPEADASGTANIGVASGRVSLFSGATRIDTVGYGTGTGEGQPAATPSTTTSIQRDAVGTDTDNNRADFALATPTPTNSAGQVGVAAPAFQDAALTIVSATAVEGQPGSVVVRVTDPEGNPVTSGDVRIVLNGLRTTYGEPVDATGTATLVTTPSGLGNGAPLAPGEYPLVVEYVNGAGFNRATLNGSYTVTAAPLPTPAITSYQSCEAFGFNVTDYQPGDQLRIDGIWGGQPQFTTVGITEAGWWSGPKPTWQSATAVVVRDGVALEETRISIETAAACLPTPVITSYQSCDAFGFNVADYQPGDQLRIDGIWSGQGQYTTAGITEAGWWSGPKPTWESATAVVVRDGVALEETRISIETASECKIIEVAPAAPQFSDVNGWKHDRVVIPTTEGVSYLLNGQPVSAGSHPVSKAQQVTVTAVATEGHALDADAQSSWSHSFRNNNGRG